jgi:hypothetical protein
VAASLRPAGLSADRCGGAARDACGDVATINWANGGDPGDPDATGAAWRDRQADAACPEIAGSGADGLMTSLVRDETSGAGQLVDGGSSPTEFGTGKVSVFLRPTRSRQRTLAGHRCRSQEMDVALMAAVWTDVLAGMNEGTAQRPRSCRLEQGCHVGLKGMQWTS